MIELLGLVCVSGLAFSVGMICAVIAAFQLPMSAFAMRAKDFEIARWWQIILVRLFLVYAYILGYRHD